MSLILLFPKRSRDYALATFSAIAGSAAVLGNQIYGPYGNQRYTKGPLGTAKGYTGQYADTTGLDYYNARYYDPVVGRFVSADTVQGNEQGMDPYAYVAGNPETMNDPTGNHYVCSDEGNCNDGAGGGGTGGGSSSGGGIGNGGGGTPRPTPRPTPKHANHQPLQDSCQGNLICDAQSDANQGSNEFWMLAGKLTLLGVAAETSALLIEGFTATVAAIPIIGQALALVLSGFAALLQTLALTAEGGAILATLVASDFGTQGAKHTPSDWSRLAMNNFKSAVDQTITIGGTIITIVVAAGTLLSNIVKSPVGALLSAKDPSLLRTITGVGISAEGIGGEHAFQARADYWIGNMNLDLGYA